MTIAVYPGSFDPVHNGHVDIAVRAARIFEHLVVAVYARPLKNTLFTVKERTEMVRRSLCDLPNIAVVGYSCTTVELVQAQNAQVMVRGLRMASDFDLEYQMALTNKTLDADLETFCLFTNLNCAFLSSTTVKEIVIAGGDVSNMVPAHVQQALQEKYFQH
jgi:pantetheine-phosphate adenylyltransferase